MKFIAVVFFIFASLAAGVFAQDYADLYSLFGPYVPQASNLRDPRSNRGPVTFPSGPPPNSAETSGVIVGASGYGFVPPAGHFRFFY